MEEAAESTVVEDVSDEQVNDYFESEGEVDQVAEEVDQVTPEVGKDNANQEQQKEKYVPHQALHEERMKRKELQSRLESVEQNWQRLTESYQRQNQPKPPSFDEDPLEALRYDTEQLKQHAQQQYQSEQQRQQALQMQQAQQQFVNEYESSALEFEKTATDFRDAYKYLSTSLYQELLEGGYNPQEANRALQEHELSIVAIARRDGVNPAERIYRVAKARGYKQAPKNNGQNLDTISKGMKMSKSLNGAGGKSSNEVTLDSIAHMSQKELDAFVAEPKNWAKLSEIM